VSTAALAAIAASVAVAAAGTVVAAAADDTVAADTVVAAGGVEAGAVGSALVADARSGTVAVVAGSAIVPPIGEVGCPIKCDFATRQTATKRTEEQFLRTERLPCVLGTL